MYFSRSRKVSPISLARISSAWRPVLGPPGVLFLTATSTSRSSFSSSALACFTWTPVKLPTFNTFASIALKKSSCVTSLVPSFPAKFEGMPCTVRDVV